MNRASVQQLSVRTQPVRPLSVALAGVLAVGIAGIALAGAPAQSPVPQSRSAVATSAASIAPQPAAASGAVLNPWGNAKYERVWRAGDKIGNFNFHLLSAYNRYKLPRPPMGQAYVALGSQVLRVNTHNWKVVASIGQVNTILG